MTSIVKPSRRQVNTANEADSVIDADQLLMMRGMPCIMAGKQHADTRMGRKIAPKK
jgi:hypothetical protein